MYIIPTNGWSTIPLTKLWAIRIWQKMYCKRCFCTLPKIFLKFIEKTVTNSPLISLVVVEAVDTIMPRKQREELLEEIPDAPDGTPVPDDAAVSTDNIQHLTELIRQMKPMYCDLLRLLAMGYTNREIAESLGLTDEVVRMRLFRGRKLLWKELNSHE